jgi:DNA-binding transcriptional ArsR family regulator
MAKQKILAALVDPTRRRMFERLGRRSHTVGELARLARISQPAASQHLRVLREARLVSLRRQGTERHYRARRAGLLDLRRYLESFWSEVLQAYAGSAPPTAATPVSRGPDQ